MKLHLESWGLTLCFIDEGMNDKILENSEEFQSSMKY
jgi:hypothetical protein